MMETRKMDAGILGARELLGFLRDESAKARQVRVAVAFARQSGLALLERQIEASLNRRGEWDFLVGLDFSQTEGIVLRKLLKWKNDSGTLEFACYSDPSVDRAKTFHPKMYVFQYGQRAAAVVGSSNYDGWWTRRQRRGKHRADGNA